MWRLLRILDSLLDFEMTAFPRCTTISLRFEDSYQAKKESLGQDPCAFSLQFSRSILKQTSVGIWAQSYLGVGFELHISYTCEDAARRTESRRRGGYHGPCKIGGGQVEWAICNVRTPNQELTDGFRFGSPLAWFLRFLTASLIVICWSLKRLYFS